MGLCPPPVEQSGKAGFVRGLGLCESYGRGGRQKRKAVSSHPSFTRGSCWITGGSFLSAEKSNLPFNFIFTQAKPKISLWPAEKLQNDKMQRYCHIISYSLNIASWGKILKMTEISQHIISGLKQKKSLIINRTENCFESLHLSLKWP